MAKNTQKTLFEDVRDVPFGAALSERYLSYALSTIMARSLPDVRDGLKPVHRRLLFAMRELGLDPKSGYKKAARVVGDVIGKFHPHGDIAIYEALVRLAQDFSQRYPLIDGQGNFGNIDGDSAAAMRYTEARLTPIAQTLLDGLDENAADFRETFDGETREPVVLPAAFPNLLANGASGIAVGMATNIPPHNAGEICDALLYLLKTPNARISTLLEYMPGPDFPTGGEIVESPETIEGVYATGRGSLRTRARWKIEKLSGGTWQIVVYEIPYQVNKARLIEKVAESLAEKKLPFLDDIRDESSEDIRLVLVPKSRNVDPAMLMESMFQSSDLETRFGVNLNVLDATGVPRVMNLRELLQAFLDHRHNVLQRMSRHRLEQIDDRLEMLEGYLIVYLNLDAVIKIIREEDEPKPKLMKKFKLTDRQAEGILNMRLRSLRKLEEMGIKNEKKSLSDERKDLKALLADEKLRWQRIGEQIKQIKAQFGSSHPLGKRRTQFGAPPSAAVIELPSAPAEPVTIICSDRNWVRAMRGHEIVLDDIKYKEGDSAKFTLRAQSTDKILFAASNGRFYTVNADKLPGGRGFGDPLTMMVDMGDATIVGMSVYKAEDKILVVSQDGKGFVVSAADALGQTRAGKVVMVVDDGNMMKVATPAAGDTVAITGTNRRLLLFPLSETPELGKGRGVILMRYAEGELADAKVFTLKNGLAWMSKGAEKIETNLTDWLGKRAQSGRVWPKSFPSSGKFSG
ncbi:MAG: DNA topoisomerase IV subunit A [Dongiaceae bacterium]